MNDVFISYSRRDKVFTQKLYETLKAVNREVWADWDSIPAASDWDAEIKQGIQETNSVLFLLSPEWIKSNECRKELVHAVAMGKRLFPILYLPVDPNDVPPELAKINWVYMRDTDDFDRAFQTLCSAMDTDLDWIKTHTRIQVRAVEWEKKSRSASFALRGEDLTEGEQFIAGAANKSPVPTPLQSEYILASRKDATKRQRQTLAGVTVALVVSIVLGVAALFQRQEAVAQKATAQANLIVAQTARVDANNNAATAVANEKEAKRQAQIALARQLASQAQFINSARSSNQMVASLLNIQSMKLFPNTDAANFLINNNHSPYLISSATTGDFAGLVDFSPDAKYVVVGSDNAAHMWEIATGREVARMTHANMVKFVAFSPDGNYIVSSDESIARVWEAVTGKDIAQISVGVDSSLAFSPDGKYIVGVDSGSGDKNAHVWEAMTGKEIVHIAHNAPVRSVAFSPDGKYVVSGSDDSTARVWEIVSGKEIARMIHHGNDVEMGDYVSSVAFSPDGKYVVTYFEGRAFHVWEVASGKEIARMGNDSPANYDYVAFSPDSKYLISVCQMCNTTQIWEAMTGKEVTRMDNGGAISWTFSPDGKYLASGGYDGTARVWEWITGKEVARMTHDGWVNSVAFSPDGKYIISTSADHTACVWDSVSGRKIAHITGVNYARFGEGNYLISLSEDGILQVWDSVDVKGNVRILHGSSVVLAAFSPDGKYIISSSGTWGDSTARVWDAASEKEIARISIYSSYVAFSPDSKYVVSGSADKTARVWEAMTGKEIVRMTHDANVWPVAFSPDGKHVVSGSNDKTARVWEAMTGKEVARMTHDDNLTYVAFSPDGKYVVSGSNDGTVRVWEAMNGKEVARMTHDGTVWSVAFSPDGKYVVSSSQDKTARVWEAMTGKEVARMAHDGAVNSVAFSLDGKYVVSGSNDGTAHVWEAMTGKEVARMTHDAPSVRSVAFSPDGKYVVSGGCEIGDEWVCTQGSARVWEAMTGKEVTRKTHDGWVNSVAFSPDGKYVVSGSEDGTVRIWAWQPEDIIANACATMPRNLTRAEWAQFIGDAMPYQAVCDNLTLEPEVTATPTATP